MNWLCARLLQLLPCGIIRDQVQQQLNQVVSV